MGVTLGGIGILGLGLSAGWTFSLATLQSLPYGFTSSYVWATLPLFVLMGCFASESKVSVDLFRAANFLLRRFRGAMYLVVITSSALFSTVSGSTVVNSVVFTRLALPEMLRLGYSRSLSLGCICASGAFAAVIPPSLTMVLLGLLTDQSVGRLFIAGILPGILSAIVYVVVLLLLLRFRPSLSPATLQLDSSGEEGRKSLGRSWPALALFGLVLGGIYLGWFAPSAAGAVWAFGSFLLCLKRLGFSGGWGKISICSAH